MDRDHIKQSLCGLLFLLALIVNASGCSSDTETKAADAAVVSGNIESSVKPTSFHPAKSIPNMSRALGLSLAEMQAVHGQAETNGDWYFFKHRSLQAAPSVGTLWLNWEDTGTVSLREARARAKQMLPRDARLVRSQPDTTVGGVRDVYRSRWLRSRFHKMPMGKGLGDFDPWQGERPGTFSVMLKEATDGKFFGATIGPGTG